MKILKQGDPTSAIWWIGKIITCKSCGQSVELETGDELSPYAALYQNKSFTISCTICHAETTITSPKEP